MKNGFIKAAAAVPHIRVADPVHNGRELARLAKEAAAGQVRVLVFPELCLTGSTAGDLFFQRTLTDGAEAALSAYLQETKETDLLSVVGMPIAVGGAIYNCAVCCLGGEVLGVVPKTALAPSQARWFADGKRTSQTTVTLFGKDSPFGTDLLFACRECPDLILSVQVGAETVAPLPLSDLHALGGATVNCISAASGELVGAREARRTLLGAQSMRLSSACIFANAGDGESTTDAVFGGHCLICENGSVLSERAPFCAEDMTVTEIDVERLVNERRHSGSFRASAPLGRTVEFSLPVRETVLTRPIDAHPFIPEDPSERSSRCETILSIQAAGLKTRVERAWAKKLVLGISGGLDSTLALLVMVRAMDALNRPRKDILAVTMPCFGTTVRTKSNATVLCEELGVDFRCVDIFDAVNVHFRDIGHDPDDRNVTYENSQARERTQILMDIANDCGGMVIGTGDLSELALGWATYNGDQMSMYGVNADVPKTLVRHIVAHCADAYAAQGKTALADALRDILNTPVSPELLPAEADGSIAQKTEDLVGPYELHDFYLYNFLRHGFSPEKLLRLAQQAFAGAYDDETLRQWLQTFLRRFFSQQFKRSCMPDGPKVGTVGLSPRGTWVMPSDAASDLWK